MDIEIKNIEQRYFVDEDGLYSNIMDVLIKPKSKLEFITLDFKILNSGDTTEDKP